MDVLEAIKSRQCIRAFLDKPVSDNVIRKILDAARFAPSGVNTQPWHVAVLRGNTLSTLGDRILDARAAAVADNPDYQYYPDEFFEPYKSRRKACGLALYGALHINKEDTERRLEQWNKNYRFFGAPVGMIVYMDRRVQTGSWMDLGMFMQNILVAAREFDLGTCPQAALAEHPDIVRQVLNLEKQYAIACGIAIGYPDMSKAVNQYRTERLAVDEFTKWYE
jgi:nitroreductase